MSSPKTLTILPTYKCTSACSNCCFGSHPWVEGRIPQNDILRYIQEAALLPSMNAIVFSGGECFLLQDDLVEAVNLASQLGLHTRCVSNGYWAHTYEAAYKRLSPLCDAGLGELNLSTGDAHEKFVSVENILHAASAARDLGIEIAVMVEVTAERTVTREALEQHELFHRYFGAEQSVLNIQESPWMSMDETANPVAQEDSVLSNNRNVHTRKGCDSVLKTIVATPQRLLKSCCGLTHEQIAETTLGSLDDSSIAELSEKAGSDFLKIWLAVDGPEKILSWASSIDPTINWENKFAHQCDACRFMYDDPATNKVIRENYKTQLPDILLRYALRNDES